MQQMILLLRGLCCSFESLLLLSKLSVPPGLLTAIFREAMFFFAQFFQPDELTFSGTQMKVIASSEVIFILFLCDSLIVQTEVWF